MPANVTDLVNQPLVLFAVLLIGCLLGMAVEKSLAKARRRAWRERNGWRWTRERGSARDGQRSPQSEPTPVQPSVPDAADQLRIVMGATFSIQPLLNTRESRVFKELDRAVIGLNPDWQVMAQVSLGEVLRCADPNAYRCINSKRVDLLLIDGDCQPRHAIEYQGHGHHQGTAAARDAIKREALRRAGIGYHEVIAGRTTPSDLRQLVERLVERPAATSEQPLQPVANPGPAVVGDSVTQG